MTTARHAPSRTLPTQIHGGNVVPTFAQITANGTSVWAHFYLDWQWTAWIKPQIDSAAAQGLNCIRCIGDVYGTSSGLHTTAAYLAKVRQLVGYCEAKGLWFYAVGSSQNDSLQGVSDAALAVGVGAYAACVAGFKNCIGIDAQQEASAASVTLSRQTALRDAIRTAAPNLSVGFSEYAFSAGGAAWLTASNQTASTVSDHLDYHLYYTVAGPGDAANAVAQAAGRRVILGEFGVPRNVGAAAQTARITTVKAVADRGDVAGAIVWALYPQGAEGGSEDYGAFDGAGTPRAELLTPLSAFAKAPYRARF